MRISTPGFSKEAQFANEFRYPNLEFEDAVSDLGDIYDECKQHDWDGLGALPIPQEVLRAAYCFLESIPYGVPMPSIGATPDGQLSFEWYKSPRRIVSASIDENGELHYAALIGANRHFGSINPSNGIQDVLGLISTMGMNVRSR